MTLAAETARDLMAPDPISITQDAPVAEAIALLTQREHGAAPVIDEAGHPVGVLSRTDILIHQRERLLARGVAPSAGSDPTLVRDLMTPAIFSVTAETPARTVVEQLLALKVQQVFVVDDSGALIGIVGAMDVLRRLI
jgi:CBS domain-containing protein